MGTTRRLDMEKLLYMLIRSYDSYYGKEECVGMLMSHCNIDEDEAKELLEKAWE